MILTGILLLLSVNLLLFGGLFVVIRQYRRTRSALIDLITPTGEGKPSPLFEVSNVFAQQLAINITASIKGTFMQANSVAARNEKKINQAVATDVIGMKSPWLAALSNLPAVQNLMTDNPGVITTMIGQFLRSAGQQQPGNGNEPEVEISSLVDY
jgi:hypothetical protein